MGCRCRCTGVLPGLSEVQVWALVIEPVLWVGGLSHFVEDPRFDLGSRAWRVGPSRTEASHGYGRPHTPPRDGYIENTQHHIQGVLREMRSWDRLRCFISREAVPPTGSGYRCGSLKLFNYKRVKAGSVRTVSECDYCLGAMLGVRVSTVAPSTRM